MLCPLYAVREGQIKGSESGSLAYHKGRLSPLATVLSQSSFHVLEKVVIPLNCCIKSTFHLNVLFLWTGPVEEKLVRQTSGHGTLFCIHSLQNLGRQRKKQPVGN